MSRLKLSVVIPAHNEEENLPVALHELQALLDHESIPYEIIVVNDNSTDSTGAVLHSLCQGDSRIREVTRRLPGGFGRAIRSGLDVLQGDVVIIYMADCSDQPHDAVGYYRKIEEGYDCVFGSRFVKGSHVQGYPRLKLIVNRLVNKCIQWVFWCPFNDLTNAFKAYRTEVIQECGPYRASHFNITIEMSLNALIHRYHIAQIPIAWSDRDSGVSNLKMMEMGRRYFSTLLKVLAERFLIEDDVIAERLAWRIEQEDRLADLQERVHCLEQQLQAAPKDSASGPVTGGR